MCALSRAVIYVRVSSREQAEGGYSIDAQLEACRRFVTDKDWAIEEEFTELGESARTANRTAYSAMVACLEEHGGWPHLAPVGYVNVRVSNGGRRDESVLAIDPVQAPLVIKSFELYASGNYTITSLHQHMSGLGLRNKRGTELSRSKFAELLHNKLYAGVVVHEGVEYAGAHEPLVSAELFARVQDTFLHHDRYKVRERKTPNHLRGFMVCGSCGSLMSSMNAHGRGGQYPYFFCLGRFSKRTDCKDRFLPEAEVEGMVEQVYAGLRLTAREEKHLLVALEREMANEVTFAGESLALSRKRLARASSERERLLAAYLGQAIDLPTFKREQARLGREIDEATAAIARAEADDAPYRELLTTALDIIRNAREGHVEADSYSRRLLNRQMLEGIEITGGQVTAVELKQPFHGLFVLAGLNKTSLVEGPGFEPGASRSRIVRHPVRCVPLRAAAWRCRYCSRYCGRP